MIAYKLDRDISCDEICKALQQMFQKLRQNNVDLSNKVLKVEIFDIVDTNIDIIPKLEHKEI